MKRLILGLMLAIAIMCASQTVGAQSADERIHSFDSTITISRDDVAHVRETIVYDFGTTEHHGIYRDIPIDYQDGSTRYYITAKYGQTIDENGQNVKAETSEVDGNLRVKLGDANKTITGIHTYIITYTLSPVIMKKDGRPFLNLDALGAGWEVPVDNFSAMVLLDNNAVLSNVQWFGADSQRPGVIAQNLSAYHPVTINAFLPDGYITTFLEPNKPRPLDVWNLLERYWVPAVVIIGGGAVIITVALRKWRAYRRRKSQTVIPEYEAPQGMTPAQVGLLDDDTADMREVTATVIDWAVRGYLKITQTEKEGLFGGKSYTLSQLKSGSDLPDSESELYDAFFTSGKEVKLKDLDKSMMAVATTEYRKAVKNQLSDAGFYDKHGSLIERGNLTEAGAQQWAKVSGFKLYMNVVEKDRLKFSDAPEKTPERFNKLLPYAVALGVEKQWAKQFEGIDVSEATTWYSGSLVGFSAINLADDLGSSFASTVSSNASVSSSGGSAGGGVGGGGGGSW